MQNIIGHEAIRNKMINSIKAGNIAHAHLIAGEDGIGKSLIAHEAAVNIIGRFEKGASEREYVDIKVYRVLQDRKSISVEQIRNMIEEINKKPYEGDKKVIILHNAEKMTVQAQNAFLKTIEEPPFGVYIFLLCESLENVLDTIKSRCQIHKLSRLTQQEIETFLSRLYKDISKEAKKAAIAYCDGIPGKAEKFINDTSFKQMRQSIIEIIIQINKKDIIKYHECEDILLKYNGVWHEVLACFLSYIRDVMIYKETGIDEFIINLDKIEYIKELANAFSYKKLNSIVQIINNAKQNLEANVNFEMVYSVMLMEMQGA